MTRGAVLTLAVVAVGVAIIATSGVAAGADGDVTVDEAIEKTEHVQSLLEKEGNGLVQMATGGLFGLGIGLTGSAGLTYLYWSRQIP